jgi:hypothetical protein
MAELKRLITSEDEIAALLQSFEDCTLPDSEFKHAEHLLVAFSYFRRSRLTVPQTAKRMRAALLRYLAHHGGDRQIYNETITLFWIRVVESFLKRRDTAGRSQAELAQELIESFASSKLIYDYFSRETLLSEEARKRWVEPDVKPLDF